MSHNPMTPQQAMRLKGNTMQSNLEISVIEMCDGYKLDHRRQFPEGTTLVYSNFTPRQSRTDADFVIFFGLQYFIKEYLIRRFNDTFFSQPKHEVISDYQEMLNAYLGPNDIGTEHIAALHDLGYLPLRIKALPEGTKVGLQIPCFTIENTHPDFFWLTNFIETMISAVTWGPCTSATTAFMYRKRFNAYAVKTGVPLDFCGWQGHDFSFRGMWGTEAACASGAGHLLSFTGTDTVPAISFLEKYYSCDRTKELIGGSVPASEHAVMCAGGKETEEETYRRLITKVYPTGIVSIVSDTWDFFGVVTKTLPALKNAIMSRNGKLVIRPDSGVPEDILCGDEAAPEGTNERKGLIQLLWEIFGGTVNEKGYKVLDPHIGAIYGDAITLQRQEVILSRLEKMGFASCNVVLGIGSFSFQYCSRDTYGFAMKATYCEVNGESREIFKQPKTDSKKNSARGLLYVESTPNGYKLHDRVTREKESSPSNALKTVFEDGALLQNMTLAKIRENVAAELAK